MAVYNGRAFLSSQLDSIRLQLGEYDEIVAIDDCSADGSVELLVQSNDPRVRVGRHHRNRGVVATFQSALEHASGEIIFLSDQDDVWLPGKVDAVLAAFEAYPDVTLVATDACVIDEGGVVIADSFYAERGGFRRGLVANLIQNRYMGCTLAFRRSLLDRILPIPSDVPMHDSWIGIVNATYGKTRFIDNPLVAYRRHGRNASPGKHARWLMMVKWRGQLLKNLVARIVAGIGVR